MFSVRANSLAMASCEFFIASRNSSRGVFDPTTSFFIFVLGGRFAALNFSGDTKEIFLKDTVCY